MQTKKINHRRNFVLDIKTSERLDSIVERLGAAGLRPRPQPGSPGLRSAALRRAVAELAERLGIA